MGPKLGAAWLGNPDSASLGVKHNSIWTRPRANCICFYVTDRRNCGGPERPRTAVKHCGFQPKSLIHVPRAPPAGVPASLEGRMLVFPWSFAKQQPRVLRTVSRQSSSSSSSRGSASVRPRWHLCPADDASQGLPRKSCAWGEDPRPKAECLPGQFPPCSERTSALALRCPADVPACACARHDQHTKGLISRSRVRVYGIHTTVACPASSSQ